MNVRGRDVCVRGKGEMERERNGERKRGRERWREKERGRERGREKEREEEIERNGKCGRPHLRLKKTINTLTKMQFAVIKKTSRLDNYPPIPPNVQM